MRRPASSKCLKKILRRNFAFHQNCPIYFHNGHKWPQNNTYLITRKLNNNIVKSSTRHKMSTNLKQKRKNGRGKKLPSFLRRWKRESRISMRLHIYIATRMIMKPRSRWKQSFAKNRKAVVSWTIGCIAYVRLVVPCRTGGNGLQQIQYTFPTEKILGNKFLIVDSAFKIQKI